MLKTYKPSHLFDPPDIRKAPIKKKTMGCIVLNNMSYIILNNLCHNITHAFPIF